MSTRNRRHFVGQAIWYFLRQDYANRELIVVDDGNDAVDDLVPNDPRIKYIRTVRQRENALNLALAGEMARGELVARWADDYWYAPDRITAQVNGIRRDHRSVCGIDRLMHYDVVSGRAWISVQDDSSNFRCADTTLMLRRSAWLELAASGQLLTGAFRPQEVASVEADHPLAVAILHQGNAAVEASPGETHLPLSLTEIGRTLGDDRDYYVSLRNGVAPREPRWTWALGKEISLASVFKVYDGYGSMAEYLALGLDRAGADVHILPLDIDLNGTSPRFQELFGRPAPVSRDGPILFFSVPQEGMEQFGRSGNLFINTTWEANRLPQGWAEKMNRARGVITPTRFVARVFRDSGVSVPVEVVPQGIDPDVYSYCQRPRRDGVTTLIVGTIQRRKHVEEGLAAWQRAFEGDPTARLIIKSRFGQGSVPCQDGRITFVNDSEATRGILHWYQEADVLLALGSEGFGLPLVEGMATGLPVIALDSEGQSDICEDARGLVLPVVPAAWEPANEAPTGPAGVRGVPGVGDVAERLRWVTTHREEAAAMGRSASEWAIKHRNVWNMGPEILAHMEELTTPRRPLRRRDLIECGAPQER